MTGRGGVLLALAAILALGGWLRHDYARTTRHLEEPLPRDEACYHQLASSVARGEGLRAAGRRRVDSSSHVPEGAACGGTPSLLPWLLGAAYALAGHPLFTPPLRLDVFPEARRLACGDVDRDGAGDLFVISPDGGVQLLLHRGDRQWIPSWQLPIPPGAAAFAVADLDRDRIAELLAAHPARGTVSVAHRRWGGGFQVEEYPAGVEHPLALVVCDVTGDGMADVAAAGGGEAGGIAILPGDGRAALLEPRIVAVEDHPRVLRLAPPGPGPTAGESTRRDAAPPRGDPESAGAILALDPERGELHHYRTGGGGDLLEDARSLSLPHPVDAATGDLDEDGRPEILVACRDGPSLVILHGPPRHLEAGRVPSLTPASDPIPLPAPPLALFTGDYDFDLHQDAAVRLEGDAGILVLFGDGRGGLHRRGGAMEPRKAGAMELREAGATGGRIAAGGRESLDVVSARLSTDRSDDLARLLPGGRLEILPGDDRLRTAQNLQLLLGLGTILAVFALTSTLAGPRCALVAALFAAVDPDLLGSSATILPEPLLMLATTSFLLLHLRARRRGTAPSWSLAGAALAVTFLTRATLLALPLLLLAEILLLDRSKPRLALHATLGLIAGILVILAPWTLRNAVALHRFVPVAVPVAGEEPLAASDLPAIPDPAALAAIPAEDGAAAGADSLGRLLQGRFLRFWVLPERFAGPYPLLGDAGSEGWLGAWPRARAWLMLAALAGLVWIGVRRGAARCAPLVTLLLYHLALTLTWPAMPRDHLQLEPLFDALAAIGLLALLAGLRRGTHAIPWAAIVDWEVPGVRPPQGRL